MAFRKNEIYNDNDDSMSISSSEDTHYYMAENRSSVVNTILDHATDVVSSTTTTIRDKDFGRKRGFNGNAITPVEPTISSSTVASSIKTSFGHRDKRKRALQQDRTVSEREVTTSSFAVRSGKDMIRTACHNRYNFENFELLEWSEAVLLQLCSIDEPLDFKNLDWQAVKRILYYRQWCSEITNPLQEYVGSKERVSNIIIRNHVRKVALGLIEPKEMFTLDARKRLAINYRLLLDTQQQKHMSSE